MTAATVEDLRRIEKLLVGLSQDQIVELIDMPGISEELDKKWLSNPQQQIALDSPADEVFFGGQAGGGKTELLLGMAYRYHKRSLILRRTNKEASRFQRRFCEIVGTRDGWNGQTSTFTFPDGKLVEFGGCQLEEDKQKYKGEPKDLIGFDEVSDFTESQYRFICGWNRSATKGQRCRVMAAGNPPTTPEGFWVLRYWGAWLDPTHPNPAKPGEIRWYTTISEEDQEVDGPGPHLINGEEIMARSRTFIPSTLDDNPDLADTNYGSVLASLPEELRQAYKEGRFTTVFRDDEAQVIPTHWVMGAQERWNPDGYRDLSMTAMALDCAGGGKDIAAIAYRYGGWFSEVVSVSGKDTADGTEVAGKVLRHRKHGCPVVIDVGGGYAGAVIERFKDNNIPYHKFNSNFKTNATALGTGLRFANKRAEAWWKFREALDPDQEGGSVIALPPDPQLRADLASSRWKLGPNGIQLESKDDIRKRIGRSPDKGDAVVMCLSEGDRAASKRATAAGRKPKVILGYDKIKKMIRR